jgi:acetolactate synthase-1/3 small subunit
MSKVNINRQAVLELTVRNHPGVMSHICGLFSRRAFNVDGILVQPLGNGKMSRVWLRVQEGERLQQVESQLHKLHDVHAVRRHPPDHAVFCNLEHFFQE